jgi:hypothetical protein
MLQYVKDQVNQPGSSTMDESAVLLLTTAFMDACYKQTISGPVAQHVLTYFQFHFAGPHFAQIMPIASVVVRMFNAQKKLPYKILAMVSPSARYMEGHNQLWPMDFCLPISNFKFAYQYNQPTWENFAKPLQIERDDIFIHFMQALLVFCVAMLRSYDVPFSKESLSFCLLQDDVIRNLCMYFGFAMDEPTFAKRYTM